MTIFYEATNVPVQSCLLLTEQKAALAFPTRDLALGFCESCGFITNVLFDPLVVNYSTTYEEQQSFSPRFNAFARELALRLIQQYELYEKDIVEIGCGKGDFLILLCELGANRGMGIDPSYVPGRSQTPAASRISFIQDFYSERYAHFPSDLVCCRHTLEHIYETGEFVRTVRRAIGNRTETVVFFEVPDVRRVLRELAFWDVYFEHCSYFSLGSLARLFRSAGFEVLDLAKAFDDQYLLLDARPTNGAAASRLAEENDLEELGRDVRYFAENYASKIEAWRQEVERIRSKKLRAVIWGSSSKCVSFLSTLGIRDEIEFVVDINPYRQGRYLAGSGKKIVPPEFLRQHQPDTVIVMNSIYCEEIRADLDRMGLSPKMVVV
jgi:SAM-dependent methyltransferase